LLAHVLFNAGADRRETCTFGMTVEDDIPGNLFRTSGFFLRVDSPPACFSIVPFMQIARLDLVDHRLFSVNGMGCLLIKLHL